MVPGWIGSVPVQHVFQFLYLEHLVILRMVTQFHFEQDLCRYLGSLLIGPGMVPGQLLRTKAHDIHKLPLQVWYTKSINAQYNYFVTYYVTSSKPKKLVPGTYSTTWSYLAYNKNMEDEEKYLHARRRVYNLHLIQISARNMHVWQQYSADKIWSRVPGVGPGFYSFPAIRTTVVPTYQHSYLSARLPIIHTYITYLHTYVPITYISLLGSFLSYPTLPFLVPIEIRFGLSWSLFRSVSVTTEVRSGPLSVPIESPFRYFRRFVSVRFGKLWHHPK